jgi:acetoin utilization protein AcuB
MTKQVVTIGPNADITEARDLMVRYRFRHLPVIREDNTLIGIVTDRDIRSAMPSKYLQVDFWEMEELGEVSGITTQEIMTKDPVTLSAASTIQDALLLIQRARVGAFPVVDDNRKVVGIISDRDLLRAFVNLLGIKEPGTLLGIVVDEHVAEMEKIVRAIAQENIALGSVLVARQWREGKRAVFPYLFTMNVTRIKQKFEGMGYELLDPVKWYIDQREP